MSAGVVYTARTRALGRREEVFRLRTGGRSGECWRGVAPELAPEPG